MISILVFSDSGKTQLLYDFSNQAQDVTFSTNEHGFAVLSFFVPLSFIESFKVYNRAGLPHVHISDRGTTCWEGRLEDVSIVNGGVRLAAFGYQRAMGDVPYTAMWSTSSYADWFVMDNRMSAESNPDQFSFDNNNRLYISPQEGSTQGVTAPARGGRWGFVTPHSGLRNISAITFSYEFSAPSNWRGALQSWGSVYYPVGGSVWGSPTTEWTVSGSGTLQTGGTTLSIAGTAVGLNYLLYYNAGTAIYGSATGTDYLKITNLRLKSTTSGSVFADEIVDNLIAYVNGINSDQISARATLVESPGVDLIEAVYLDLPPSEILNELIQVGDNEDPPRQWEWGVYEDRQLFFRPRGSAGRSWYVDASLVEVNRSLDELENSVYSVYSDESGRDLRGGVRSDAPSIARYGVTRRRGLSVNTTSSATATTYALARLDDRKDITPRSSVIFDRLYDSTGGLWPLWMCRSGDTITIRNLPPSISTALDKIRTFRVAETEYNANDNTLNVTPEAPIPSLQTVDARRNTWRIK